MSFPSSPPLSLPSPSLPLSLPISQTWKKRWFVLTQKDPFNPRSVELNYYTDSSMSERRGTIDMTSITRIHPSPSKAKGHIFSIEVKDRKIMLKAEDPKTKSIWIAKLYEFAGQGWYDDYTVLGCVSWHVA